MTFRLRRSDPREADILHEVLAALRLHYPSPGAWWERANSGGMKRGKRFVRFGVGDGCPDILGCVGGRFVAVEVKRPGEKIRDNQAAWKVRHVAAGGVCVVATSWQQCVLDVRAELEAA